MLRIIKPAVIVIKMNIIFFWNAGTEKGVSFLRKKIATKLLYISI